MIQFLLKNHPLKRVKSSGSWIKSDSRWWYKHSDNSYTTDGWGKINGTWHYFDNEG
ncbi:hypothetical protein [uncultured Streptococcus sp.]|uniref:hypothetical protein n=1 Tax=uncultured Streptococcus sp. TaxID=83427 RepID=UPI0035A5DDDD